MNTSVPNPRTYVECGYRGSFSKHHEWEEWRREGWLVISRCKHCGRNRVRDGRPRGIKECLVCQKPLPARKRNWCGDPACWKRRAAYSNPTGWSEYVHYRFKETCQDCGVVQERMEAHHIQPIERGGIELDPDNGVLLCHECHLVRHRAMA